MSLEGIENSGRAQIELTAIVGKHCWTAPDCTLGEGVLSKRKDFKRAEENLCKRADKESQALEIQCKP